MAQSSKEHHTHEILSRFSFIEEQGDWVKMRVEAYDPEKGILKTEDEDGHGGNEWHFDGEKWVCVDSHYEVEGDMHFNDVVGAAKCLECAAVFTATSPDEDYCGCRH